MDFFGPRRPLNPMAADRPRKAKGYTENAIHPADVSKEAATRKRDRKALTACCPGFITQAMAAHFTFLLFLESHGDHGIPPGKIARIATVFFLHRKRTCTVSHTGPFLSDWLSDCSAGSGT